MRKEGDEVSAGVCDVEGADDGFWNILRMSSFAGLEGVEGTVEGGVEAEEDGANEDLDEIEDFPLTWP